MNILAVETSTMLGGIAIVDEKKGLVAETRLNVKTTHSERLMTVIEQTLMRSDLVLDDIDVYAVTTGPGSFTGLRIGLSTVKGLSYATGKPMVGVPTLDAFAWNFPWSRYPVCLMLDARRCEVYAAVFEWVNQGFEKLIEDVSVKPAELLKGLQGNVLFAGEGVQVYQNEIVSIMKERAFMAPPDKMVPSPANVAILGLQKAHSGRFIDAAKAAPVYIRKSEAEVKWSKKPCPES